MTLVPLNIALRELWANALRSFLAALGIVIGVGAVVCIVTISSGISSQVSSELSSLGNNLLSVEPYRPKKTLSSKSPTQRPLTTADALAITRSVQNVTLVVPVITRSLVASQGRFTHAVTVTGTTASFFELRSWSAKIGGVLTNNHIVGGRKVCVLGDTAYRNLFAGGTALGSSVRIGNFVCKVVGVLRQKGHSVVSVDQDNIIVVPLTTMQSRIERSSAVHQIWVSVADENAIPGVIERATKVLIERRRLRDAASLDFSIFDMRQARALVSDALSSTIAVLAAIAAVSLVVGGIGVMNVMLASIAERTREIGIRMAIGATDFDIALQFLSEAGILSAIGGSVGVALGMLAAFSICQGLGIPFEPNVYLMFAGVACAVLLGVSFGLVPALRAARLTPIEALSVE